MALRRRAADRTTAIIWPGFVDAMTALLLVVMFLLSIFMVTQYFLRETISGQDEALALLGQDLDKERNERARLSAAQARLEASLEELRLERAALEARRAELEADLAALNEGLEEARRETEAERAALALAASEREVLEAMLEDLSTKALGQDEAMRLLGERLADEQARAASASQEAEALRETLSEEEQARIEAMLMAQKLREELAQSEAALNEEEKQRIVELAAREALRARLEKIEAELAKAGQTLAEERQRAEETLTLLAAAQSAEERLGDERDIMEAQMLEAEELLAIAQGELAARDEAFSDNERRLKALTEQTGALKQELGKIAAALDAAEARGDVPETAEAADIGTRLNLALASKVDELSKFRSEFFGKVRAAVDRRNDVRIVGDRFVFPSEVLFQAGSADLGAEGRRELSKFAALLREISADIPEDVNWVLRVDGHTDRLPVRRGRAYADNWELSQARALSVAKYLINQENIPPNRLAPTGFGEFQPIDSGNSREALARNRRIELKLTER